MIKLKKWRQTLTSTVRSTEIASDLPPATLFSSREGSYSHMAVEDSVIARFVTWSMTEPTASCTACSRHGIWFFSASQSGRPRLICCNSTSSQSDRLFEALSSVIVNSWFILLDKVKTIGKQMTHLWMCARHNSYVITYPNKVSPQVFPIVHTKDRAETYRFRP